ncbi:MAG TPA: 3-hydroxyacyl-CoA dehydrogenase NAD-binding domain-containing protein [Symbiobacteriaceae bacterium]|nr:3-hydroxyacyl-CoA dehydrogenase NAD-binding domain-containing protein [Symbiobacteriaceae bacterium]
MIRSLGVVGAGTMGAGIAQIALQAGLPVYLYDLAEGALQTAQVRIEGGLARLVAKGRLTPADRTAALARLTLTSDLRALAAADLIIEAAPEQLQLKRDLFKQLDEFCPPGTILATNTSALPVTELAAATGRPDRFVGLHFFNPVPLMALVEVVQGARTSAETMALAEEFARRIGKSPVRAKDTPGFIVNRVARPFPGEALRLVGEGVATPVQVDRIARLAAGFRMGPFELMDLVGMDVNYAVNRSVWEQFFGEPRFRPHPLQAQMVQAGLLGRKTGRGWYRYEGDQQIDGPASPQYAESPAPRPLGLERVWVQGSALMAGGLTQPERPDPTGRLFEGQSPAGLKSHCPRRLPFDWIEAVGAAGYYLVGQSSEAQVVLLTDPHELTAAHGWTGLAPGALLLWDGSACDESFLAPHVPLDRSLSFAGLPPLGERRLVELGLTLTTKPEAAEQAAQFLHSLGRETEIIQATPGLVALRLIACLANEAAWALQEGVADAASIDTAMQQGVNYPHGPLAWADRLGPDRILATLEALQRFTGDDRYRPAPLLRRVVASSGTFWRG